VCARIGKVCLVRVLFNHDAGVLVPVDFVFAWVACVAAFDVFGRIDDKTQILFEDNWL